VKAIRIKASRADRGTVAAVRLRVDPAEFRDDLLEFLRASSCLGVKHGPREIEVHLAGYIESWKADHIHASVEIVSG
jgi:hypothetical protein